MTLLCVPVALAAVLWLAAGTGGWRALARAYPQGDERPAVRRRFRSVSLTAGWVPANYSGVITLGASPGGLFLSVLPPFDLSHPPLYLPWAAVRADKQTGWTGRWVAVRADATPGVTVWLPEHTFAELAAAAGRVTPPA